LSFPGPDSKPKGKIELKEDQKKNEKKLEQFMDGGGAPKGRAKGQGPRSM